MDKACGKDGFGAVDVLGVVDQYGECSGEVEQVVDSESAADGCPHTHKLLQAPDRQTIDPVERQAVTCGCVLELLGSDFARLQ